MELTAKQLAVAAELVEALGGSVEIVEIISVKVTAEEVADDRAETDSCERGTPGCCIRHTRDSDCETW
jgi:hypothetical protein